MLGKHAAPDLIGQQSCVRMQFKFVLKAWRCYILAVGQSYDCAKVVSDWRVEIPKHRPEDSAQVVNQTLFPLKGGVWARD